MLAGPEPDLPAQHQKIHETCKAKDAQHIIKVVQQAIFPFVEREIIRI